MFIVLRALWSRLIKPHVRSTHSYSIRVLPARGRSKAPHSIGLPLLNCFSWDGSYRIVINPLYTGGSCFFFFLFFFFECFIYTEGPWGLLDVALRELHCQLSSFPFFCRAAGGESLKGWVNRVYREYRSRKECQRFFSFPFIFSFGRKSQTRLGSSIKLLDSLCVGRTWLYFYLVLLKIRATVLIISSSSPYLFSYARSKRPLFNEFRRRDSFLSLRLLYGLKSGLTLLPLWLKVCQERFKSTWAHYNVRTTELLAGELCLVGRFPAS